MSSFFAQLRSPVVAGALLLALAAPAIAQDMSSTITCLRGEVAYGDYSELDQNMAESGWDRRAGVSLVADSGGLVLDVRDFNGNSVCEREANNATSCSLRIDRTSVDIYTVRVENQDGYAVVPYRVCAY